MTWTKRQILNKHFSQANETPFATEHWREQFRDKNIQKMTDIQPCTNLEDFKTYIKTIDEKRSSSPSGRHYGHYKTLLDNDVNYI